MAPLAYTIVDPFTPDTSSPFAGNPAAVVRVDQSVDDATLQLVAREFNLPMTAFVFSDNRLRWFTAAKEYHLCGHATLATAHVLLKSDLGNVQFETLSGTLTAK